MENRLCYLSHNYRDLQGSGNKAKHDNEVTLREMGAINLGMPTTYYRSKIASFFLDLAGVMKLAFHVQRGDIVVLQYPIKKYFSVICRMAHLRGAKVVALVHDLGAMRRKKLTVKKEIDRLMYADYVIATNKTMQRWLEKQGYRHPMGALQLHDYRSDAIAPHRSLENIPAMPRVVYAGALAPRKNTFLLKMKDAVRHFYLEIYGNAADLPGLCNSEFVHVHGFVSAEAFIAHVEGEYGLVWDGDSISECTGNFGEYLRWNTPHKASFYLRAGLPLIVWEQSALAPIVKEYGIGLCIDSIEHLEERLSTISPKEWQQIQHNVQKIEQHMQTGYFFKKALQESFEKLSDLN